MTPENYTRYEVKEFDTLSAIAVTHGLSWEMIYDDPANAELRKNRPDPNLIIPGDVVFIPKDKTRRSPERFQLGVWEGEITGFHPNSSIISVLLKMTDIRHCRYDSGKGVFIDAPLNGKDTPPKHHMDLFQEKVRKLYLTEQELKIQRLEEENAALRAELVLLKSPFTSKLPSEEGCRGGCSRGGDGPCCGKRGCRG